MEKFTESQFRRDMERQARFFRMKCPLIVYPTDTIYGLGCDATSEDCVRKVRDVKQRYERPLSVIVPSKRWIRENCVVGEEEEKQLEKLPGPYTLIMRLKNKSCVAGSVNNNSDTLGVRIPDHWIADFVELVGNPIITTSANKTGDNFVTTVDELNKDIARQIDYVINAGRINGRPSRLVDLTKEEVEVINR
ncbi:MAG: L-threonylcarbamoyladenylate synthase [Nanobdellota archaeon]